MFKSTSLANPFTTVTSSFVADRECVVTLDSLLSVRVNGSSRSGGTYDITSGDKIEVDVTSAESDKYVVVPYAVNGVQSSFAIASETIGGKSKLSTRARSKVWYDFTTPDATHQVSFSRNGSYSYVSLATSTTTAPTAETAAVLDPATKSIFFINSNGAVVSKVASTLTPIGQTRIFNGANRTWDFYVLGSGGLINKFDYQFTKSEVKLATLDYSSASAIFTDGLSLWLGGNGFLHNLSDSATPRAYTYDGSRVLYGTGAGGTVGVVTSLGNFMVFRDGAFVTVYSAKSLGKPTVFNNQFVVPSPEEYKIIYFDLQGNKLKEAQTGNLLPWTCHTGSTKLTVNCYDSPQVLVYDTTGTVTTVDLAKTATSTQEIGGSFVTSHYLSQTKMTYISPTVNNPGFDKWVAPRGAVVASGDRLIATEGENLPVYAMDGVKILVNNGVVKPVSSGDYIAMVIKSSTVPISHAVVIGNYAFDFVVEGVESPAISTELPLLQQTYNQSDKLQTVTFNVTVPSLCQNANLAVSRGTVFVNNVAYNGKTLVSGGDQIKISLLVPGNTTFLDGLLTLADSEYPLIAGTTVSPMESTKQEYQEYLSVTTVSEFTVPETGEYSLLDSQFTHVESESSPVKMPATFEAGQVIKFYHTRQSSWWLDSRYSVLRSPSRHYIFEGFTIVDGIPNDLDFGTVHMGIPDFVFPSDKAPVVDGLSRSHSIKIYAENIQFSVNGQQPVSVADIANGDKLTAFYKVKNLYERQMVYTTIYNGDKVRVGWLDIDPALGVDFMNDEHIVGSGQLVPAIGLATSLNSLAIAPRFFQTSDLRGAQPVSAFFNASQLTGVAPTFAPMKFGVPTGIAPIAGFMKFSQPTGISPVADFMKFTQPSGVASVSDFMKPSDPSSVASKNDFVSASGQHRVRGLTPLQEHASILYHISDADRGDYYSYSFGYSATKWMPKVGVKNEDNQYSVARRFASDVNRSYLLINTFWNRYTPTHRVATTGWHRFKVCNELMVEQGRLKLSNNLQFVPINFTKVSGQPLFVDVNWERAAQQPLTVTINPQFMPSQESKVELKPLLFKSSTVDVSLSSLLFKANVMDVSFTGAHLPISQIATKANAGAVEGDKLWETEEPFKTGGYKTEAEALADGQLKSGTFVVTAYQQPEGSFSYTVLRSTALICEIQPSLITANKWLIGGG